jgi:hypothetical protein
VAELGQKCMPSGVADSHAASGARTEGATACRTRDQRAGIPGLLPSGSGRGGSAASRCRRAARAIPALHDDRVRAPPASHSLLNPVLVGAYRRGFARRHATPIPRRDSRCLATAGPCAEVNIPLTACGLSSLTADKPQRVHLPKSLAVSPSLEGWAFRNFVRFLQRFAFF